jgi:muconolactone delta-isomerase
VLGEAKALIDRATLPADADLLTGYPRSSISLPVSASDPSASNPDQSLKEDTMEFLVEFDLTVPEGTTETEVKNRQDAEARAAAKLADDGHLLRVWKRPVSGGGARVIGLYRAKDDAQLAGLLEALPLYEWMQIVVTPLEPHPNDPAAPGASSAGADRSPS